MNICKYCSSSSFVFGGSSLFSVEQLALEAPGAYPNNPASPLALGVRRLAAALDFDATWRARRSGAHERESGGLTTGDSG